MVERATKEKKDLLTYVNNNETIIDPDRYIVFT